MEFIPTSIPDVIVIEPKIYRDQRGFFWETYQFDKYVEAGIPGSFVQDNHSGSKRGTLRGLHYQIRKAQGKLVWAVVGEIYDVVVDLRTNSPTFGEWVGTYLSAEDKRQVWIPEGFAHGFYVLSEWAEVFYKVTNFYAPQWERTLLWNDSDVGIEWPLVDGHPPVLSKKDAMGKPLREADVFD